MFKMTNEQFAWKVFCEAQREFILGEIELDPKIFETMFGKQIYDLILKESSKWTEKEKETFMCYHCESMYPIAQ